MIRTISIIQDGHWAGDGSLTDDGIIEDCAAILGPIGLPHDDGQQQDAAERAYEAIEEAIRRGEDTVEVEGCQYEWTVGPAQG